MTHAEMVEKIEAIGDEWIATDREDYWANFKCGQIEFVLQCAARAGYVLVPLEATEEMLRPLRQFRRDVAYSQAREVRDVYSEIIGERPGQEKEDV